MTDSPLDRPIAVTIFPNKYAKTKRCYDMSLREFAEELTQTIRRSKDDFPSVKLQTYGKKRTDQGCLRNNENVLTISGIEGDYDGAGETPLRLQEAADLFLKANVAALLYTTASNGVGHPRWRVLCPCSKELPPERRAQLVARINGVLGGVLDAQASFTLSQAMYFGQEGTTRGGWTHSIINTASGRFIDLCDDLDAGAIGKSKTAAATDSKDESRSGCHYREALHSVRSGLDYAEHLEGLDDELAAYADESRSSSSGTKGEHDWERAVAACEADGSTPDAVIKRLPDLGDAEKEFSGYYTADELAALPRPFDFVEGLIYEEQVSVWYGLPKTRKSFLALDLCCAVATGARWAGRDVEQRNVLVLPLEGRGTLIDRVRAWEIANKAKCPVIFRLKAFDLANPAHVKEVMAYVREHDIGLVVIDTLARATPGTDEDRAKDMGLIVKQVDRIKDAGAHVLIVHHANKGGSMRGSIAVAGAADLIVRLERSGEQGLAIIEENRHAKDGEVLRFTLEPQRLDMSDARGKPIMSASVKLSGEWFEDLTAGNDNVGPKDGLKAPEHAALTILRRRAKADDLLGPMSRDEARGLLKDKGWAQGKKDEAWRQAFNRLLAKLESKGVLEIDSNDDLSLSA